MVTTYPLRSLMWFRMKSLDIVSRWPQVIVVLGIVLTLVWSGLLVWLFLRLLDVV